MTRRRLPIRLRVAVTSAAATAVVLILIGLVVYERMSSELNASIDGALRSRANDLAALVQQADSGLRDASASGQPLADTRASAAQILTAGGRVIDSTPPSATTPLLDRTRLARARSATIIGTVTPPGDDTPLRMLATPVTAQDQRLVIVVAASLEQRDNALDKLLTQLLLVAPLGLLLAGASGYAIAAGALRPVAGIQRAAQTMSAERLDERIPRGPRNDELGTLTDTLNAMLDRLADAARRERRFIADAAHELRTPLATLRAELEIAGRRPRNRADLEVVIESALAETDRLCRLADDLLLLARADQGALELRRETIGLRVLIDGIARRFSAAAELRGRDIRIGAVGIETTVIGDRLRLEQAIGNLVDNALRHGAGMVTLDADRTDAEVTIHVADEGAGIPPAIAKTAFRPFQRGPRAESGSGSGLGLAIATEIARAHDGRIRTSTGPDGFSVDLILPHEVPAPVAEAPGEALPARS